MRRNILVVAVVAGLSSTQVCAQSASSVASATGDAEPMPSSVSAGMATSSGADASVAPVAPPGPASQPSSSAGADNEGHGPLDTISIAEAKAGDNAPVSGVRPKNRLLEEIVVTARKREENLRDVPISIVAVSAEKLDAAGVETAQQLDRITPGLVFGKVIGFNTVFLRGIGSDAYLPSADPSVPIYVDDINSLPSQGSIDSVGNIERIEVLKGPQGTLFGRNALGGAIRIITADPRDDQFSGELKLDGGRYSKVNANAITTSLFLNVPVMEGLATTLSGIYRYEQPLYTNDRGPEVAPEELKGGRLKLKWTASDSIAVKLAASYEKASTTGGLTGEGTDPSAVLCAVCMADPGFDYHTEHNVPALLRSNRYLISGELDWNFKLFDSKLLLSDQRLNVPEGWGDLDYTSAPLLSGHVGKQYGKQRTAELRFQSNEHSPWSDHLTWVAGAYYLDSAGGYDPLYIKIGTNALAALPQLGGAITAIVPQIADQIATSDLTFSTSGILKTQSVSEFAESTYTVFDRLSLTAGLRYDSEERRLPSSLAKVSVGTDGAPVTFGDFHVPNVTTTRWSPRGIIKWQFDTAQVFASYSVGYLSPTYNTVNIFKAPDFVKQEKDTAYELGFKGSYLSGLVQLEGALFHIERHNIITAFTALTSGGAVSFFNAPKGEVNGAELSVQTQPLYALDPGLSLIASGSYLHARYTDFPNGRGYDDESGLAFGPGSLFGLPARDFGGNRIVNSPKWSGTLTAAQTVQLVSDQSIELAVDLYFNSGYFFTAQNTYKMKQDEYQTCGVRLTYFVDSLKLQVTAYGQNLTDERYFSGATQLDFGPGRSLAPPRMFGLRTKWAF